MKYRTCVIALVAMGLVLTSGLAFADTIDLTSSNDTYIRTDRSYLANGTTDNVDFRYDFTSYFQFDLSSLSIDTINSATLTLHKLANARNDSIVSARVAMYGLSDIVGNTEQNWDESDGGWQVRVPAEDHGLDFRNVGSDWLAGTGAVEANLAILDMDLGANVTESVIDGGITYTLSGPDLVTFLSNRVAVDGLVTFVVEPTDTGGRGWGWATKEHADAGLHPTLSLDYVPEPSVAALLLGGVGLFGLVRRRK